MRQASKFRAFELSIKSIAGWLSYDRVGKYLPVFMLTQLPATVHWRRSPNSCRFRPIPEPSGKLLVSEACCAVALQEYVRVRLGASREGRCHKTLTLKLGSSRIGV
jgi:hypothetical protein